MLSFEIGQRESGFYSERTESQNHRWTDGQTDGTSTMVLVYRYTIAISIYYIYIDAVAILVNLFASRNVSIHWDGNDQLERVDGIVCWVDNSFEKLSSICSRKKEIIESN